jgi:hypothetical protein
MVQAGPAGSRISSGDQTSLSEIHTWQASPQGIIAFRMMDLMAAISELEQLAGNPNVLPLIAAERTDLELANAGLGRLLSRVPS